MHIAVSIILALRTTENLAGHGFVSVNIRPCLYIHYLFLVYDKGRISNENCAQTIFFNAQM